MAVLTVTLVSCCATSDHTPKPRNTITMPTAALSSVPPSVAKKKRLNCSVFDTYACCTFLTPDTTTVSPSTRTMAVSCASS